MGILSKFFSRAKIVSESGESVLFGGYQTSSGESVNTESAMRITAVFSCVKLISETLATLPLPLYKLTGKNGENRERAKSHPLYSLLYTLPNPYQTSTEFRETLQMHALLRGNGYARATLTKGGYVAALHIMHPDKVTPTIKNGVLFYEYISDDGKKETIPYGEVLHIRGPSLNGIVGLSPIDYFRETLGSAQAMDRHAGSTWKNGARVNGVLTHPGKMTPQGYQNLKESWSKQATGAGNSGGTAILENGMKYETIGMTPEQSKFIESKKLSRSEIASIFHVPPHMIGEMDRATFSNIEHQSLEFIQYTMRPWFVRWEQSISARLLGPSERETYKAEFNADALLRGDFLGRQQGLAIQRQNGIINIDEWRALENRNPLDGGKGTDHLVPMNMQPAGSPPPEPTPGTPGGVPTSPGSGTNEPVTDIKAPKKRALITLVETEIRRIVRKEWKFLEGAQKRKSADGVNDFLNTLQEEIQARMAPILDVICEDSGLPLTGPALATVYAAGCRKRAEAATPTESWEAERLPVELKAFFENVESRGQHEASGKAV